MTSRAARYIVEILLPLFDNQGERFAPELFRQLRNELVETFGGLTAFVRNPAVGLWEQDGETDRDDIVIFEVMADRLDHIWWSNYRSRLEARFRQEVIVIRAHQVLLL